MTIDIRHDASPLPPGTVACIGAFDGLHLGHQALLATARKHGDPVALVTFDPHPQRVLAPDRPLSLLLTPPQRVQVATWLGVDYLVLLPFSQAMANLAPEEFVRHYLVEQLAPNAVVVGEDFRFGAQRKGNARLLAELLQPTGILVHIVAPVMLPEPSSADMPPAKLGSTTVRMAVTSGDVEQAAHWLGRFHGVLGRVVRGDGRGRTLGIPTANIQAPSALMPGPGVYATWITPWSSLAGAANPPWPAVANIGTNPTFTQGHIPRRLEVHILDQDLGQSLYGADLEVLFVARLRDEQRFSGPEDLVAAIRDDIRRATELLTPDSAATVLPAGSLP